MSNFAKKKVEVLNHWIAFVDGFSTSPSEFYARLQSDLGTREVPGLEIQRIEFAEGGILSFKRTYLRLVRERLVFDVCAAPFGRGYFFSCRSAEIPAVVQPLEFFCLLATLLFLVYLSVRTVGVFLGPLLLISALAGLIYIMRNAVALGLEDLDRTIIRTPLLGPVYEAWLRKETYYRQDTRLMYLDLVPRVVRDLAEHLTGAKGIYFTREYIHAPVLGDLYKHPHEHRGGQEQTFRATNPQEI